MKNELPSSVLIPVAIAANRLRLKSGLKPLELSFWEEGLHPRGEHGRFAAKGSGGSVESSGGSNNLHSFFKSLGEEALETVKEHPLLTALLVGGSAYMIAPALFHSAAFAVAKWGIGSTLTTTAKGAATVGSGVLKGLGVSATVIGKAATGI